MEGKLLLIRSQERGVSRQLHRVYRSEGWGVVAFQEDSGESSRIGTSFLVCVRIHRSWRTSFLYLYHEMVGTKNTLGFGPLHNTMY